MLDFNSKTQGRITAQAELSRALNGLIDRALEQERAAQPDRGYVGMSELGDPCLRRVYYNAIGAPRRPLDGAKLRIFEAGHLYESMAARWLRLAGFELVTADSQGRQLRVTQADGRISGGIDGLLLSGPSDLPQFFYPALWENKSLKAKWWNIFVKSGVRKAEPKYYGQVQMYMGYFNLEVCLFTAENKDTSEIYPEIIPYDRAEAQRYSDGGVAVIRAIEVGEPPPRIASSAAYFVCEWCDFRDECWREGRGG